MVGACHSFLCGKRMHSSRMRTVRCSGRRGRGCLPRGVSAKGDLPRGGCLPQFMLGYTHPPVNRITDACGHPLDRNPPWRYLNRDRSPGLIPPEQRTSHRITDRCKSITFLKLRLRAVNLWLLTLFHKVFVSIEKLLELRMYVLCEINEVSKLSRSQR